MGDIDLFGGFSEGGESFDAAAFEKFKERMKRAAAQLKAIQKSEQKQKKTEDELIKILVKFLKSGKKKDILLLVIRLLEMNVPAGFIVSLLLISNENIQQELKINLLPSGSSEEEQKLVAEPDSELKGTEMDAYIGGDILPLKVKIAIAKWINEIQKKVNEKPHKIIQTCLDKDEMVNLTVIQLGTFSLRDYLQDLQIEHNYEQLKDFIDFIISDILKKTAKDLENRKELEEGERN